VLSLHCSFLSLRLVVVDQSLMSSHCVIKERIHSLTTHFHRVLRLGMCVELYILMAWCLVKHWVCLHGMVLS